MENEVRHYLKYVRSVMNEEESPVPQYIVTAVRLPTGAIELAVNSQDIAGKIDYILGAYNDNMELKTNSDIKMEDALVV